MRNKHCQIEFNPYKHSFCKFSALWSLSSSVCFLLYYHFPMEDSSELSYIYSLSKLSPILYETSVFNMQQVPYSEQPPEPPVYMSREQFHGRMDVKIFLMFIVAENTGSVNGL